MKIQQHPDPLKKRILTPFARGAALVAAMAIMGAGGVQAATAVGVDTTAGPNWRTAAALGLNGSTEYGADGYIVFGLTTAGQGQWMQPYNGSWDRPILNL